SFKHDGLHSLRRFRRMGQRLATELQKFPASRRNSLADNTQDSCTREQWNFLSKSDGRIQDLRVWELGAYGLPGYISAAFTSPDNGITAPFVLQDGFPAPASEPPGPGFGAVPIGQRPRLNITTLRSGHDPFAYDIDSGL